MLLKDNIQHLKSNKDSRNNNTFCFKYVITSALFVHKYIAEISSLHCLKIKFTLKILSHAFFFLKLLACQWPSFFSNNAENSVKETFLIIDFLSEYKIILSVGHEKVM